MQGKILIIDDISTNRIVLKVKMAAAYYQIFQASTLTEAKKIIATQEPDLVLTAMHLPDGSATDLCVALRLHRQTAALPVLAISSDANPATRMQALRAGAADVLQRPLNEMLLLGRVRSLIRAYHRFGEWEMRDETTYALGMAEAQSDFVRPVLVSVIGPDVAALKGWTSRLAPELRATYKLAPLQDAMAGFHSGCAPDAIVLGLPSGEKGSEECLRLIPALRASAQTRDVALLAVQETPDPVVATTALDMGADDVMIAGFDAPEAAVRLEVLLRQKKQVAQMLKCVRTGLREVVQDPLTGLYNRRYIMPYISRLVEQSETAKTPFAVILADMDHFKRINDQYGHASGDAVLVETARRLRSVTRGSDVVARIGGEEFLIALPATDLHTAHLMARQLCDVIGQKPFALPGITQAISITVSLGLAQGKFSHNNNASSQSAVAHLLECADKALYEAKIQGRNRVTLSHPQTRPAA